jgi:hypothetical protein
MSKASAVTKVNLEAIADRKAEILRLIKRVSSEDHLLPAANPDPGPVPPRLEAPPKKPRQKKPQPLHKPTKRETHLHQELTRIQKQRRQLEGGLVDDLVHKLYRGLEDRVATLEKSVAAQAGGGNGAPAQAPQPPAPGTLDFVLGGKIQEGLMADILQLVSSNILSGVFTVDHLETTLKLYFKDGEICHAQGDGLSGESAVFAALALDDGQFYFEETEDLPEERTIENKTQFLILEALRQIDEERAQGKKS